MPEDREMTPADFQAIAKDCVKRTVNFQDPVPISRPLSWFQIDTDGEIGLLKDLLTGKNNPEIGVTHFLYRLDRGYLNTLGDSTTVLELATIAKEFSVPDLTSRRALIVVGGSARKVSGEGFQPDPDHSLKTIGIYNENIERFRDTVVTDPAWGILRFRRKINPARLNGLDETTLVGSIMDILRSNSEPNVKSGGNNEA